MGYKVTSFALVLILFFAATTMVSVDAHSCQANKRDNNPLDKRGWRSQTCPCAVAQAVFTGPNVNGITVYAQNEYGQTEITGYLTGLVHPYRNQYTFLIEECGKVIVNLTDVLNVQISPVGITQFTVLDKNLNLNCDKNGIFNVQVDCDPYSHKSHDKRQRRAKNMNINQNGRNYAQAPIRSI